MEQNTLHHFEQRNISVVMVMIYELEHQTKGTNFPTCNVRLIRFCYRVGGLSSAS